MAAGFDGLGKCRASLNVTPLVDVLLVLLIIFIMIAPVLTKALQSEIPQKVATPLPEDYVKRQLVLHVGADGSLVLNREKIDLELLPARLEEVFARRGGRRILFLDADAAVAYGTVVEVMDRCRDGGAMTIGVIPDSIGPS